MTTIRRASLDDVPTLVALGGRFLRESSYAEHYADNPVQQTRLAEWATTDPAATVFLLERDGVPVGALVCVMIVHPFSGERIVSELMWWVEPETRGAGLKLLKAMERWGASQGATKIQMIAPDDRVANLYRRLGYHWVESAYQRTLTWQE